MGQNVTLLKSGAFALGTDGEHISAVLGSGIAVCIFDGVKKFGGMAHYSLPEPPAGTQHSGGDLLEFGTHAIPALLKEFKRLGSEPKNLQAKLIGGALEIGAANLAVARRLLGQFCIVISAEEVGGTCGRKVELDTSTGSIRFKKEEALETEAPRVVAPRTSKIKVLIIDDSAPMRKVIRKMIEADSEIEVVGEAADPIAAEEVRKRLRPDVLTLDLHMPKQDGVSYLRQYMPVDPLPAIIVTDYNIKETGQVMDALEAGAFDYIQKPALSQMAEVGELLVQKIKAAAQMDASHLLQLGKKIVSKKPVKSHTQPLVVPESQKNFTQMIAIGASTGGTEALKVLLMGLPKDIPPIVIVQHMPPGFTKSFADRLNELCPFQVKEAEDGDKIQGGCVYLAPGGKQMAVTGNRTELRIAVTDDPPENRFKPSVDFLFRSFEKVAGRDRVAVILTGMGRDGAAQMLVLKNKGVHTIAQDESTSVVFGMPKVAIELGGICEVKRLDQIADAITGALRKRAA